MNKRSFLLVFLLTGLLAACNFTLAEDLTPPPNYVPPTPAPTMGALFPSEPSSPARGQVIYEVKCAPCHGMDGLGNGPQAGGLQVPVSAIGLRDIASQSNPAKWFTVITRGQMDRYMPPFTSLSDSERWDVLSYVYSLSNTISQVEEGAALYANLCATCHGPNGDASKGQVAGTSVDFSNQSFMTQVTSLGMYQVIANGLPPKMEAFNSQLSEAQIWALTAYLRTLTYDRSTESPSPTIEAITTNLPTENSSLVTTPDATIFAGDASPMITPEGTQVAVIDASPTPEASVTPISSGIRITGRITNGSGGQVPTSLKLVLHGYVNMSETINLVTSVKTDGSYEFDKVPLETNIAYIVSVDVDGTSYNSDIAVYDGSTTDFDLPITVYETTTDKSSISADRVHIFFDFSNPDTIQVIEIYILSNSSNKAVVADEQDQAILTYSLPDGASNLQFENGQIGNPFISTENGFGDPSTILPGAGSYQLMYSFDMPYTKKLEIKQPFNVPVSSVIVMSPDGIKVSSDQLTDAGKRDVQGLSYSMFTVEDMASGDVLTLTISGTPKTGLTLGQATDSSQTTLVIGLAIFGLVLILAGLFFFLRGRTSQEDLEEDLDPEGTDSLGKDPDRLMDAIASLDDQYKAGTLAEEAYQKRRAELKARLKEIL
ncbi:MAG: c-type cytochrome [Chloroflexota bacterium]